MGENWRKKKTLYKREFCGSLPYLFSQLSRGSHSPPHTYKVVNFLVGALMHMQVLKSPGIMLFTSPVIRRQISMLHYTYYVTPLNHNYVIPLTQQQVFVCIPRSRKEVVYGYYALWRRRSSRCPRRDIVASPKFCRKKRGETATKH